MLMCFMTNLPTFSFSENIESFQHSAALAITEAKNLHQELGVEYHYQKRWMRRSWLLYKVFSTVQPTYIFNLLPPMRNPHRHTDSFNTVNSFNCSSHYFKNSFIPNVIAECHCVFSAPVDCFCPGYEAARESQISHWRWKLW